MGQGSIVAFRPADGQPAAFRALLDGADAGYGRFLVDLAVALNHLPLAPGQRVALNPPYDALVPFTLGDGYIVAFHFPLRAEGGHALPLLGDEHHGCSILESIFIADRLVGRPGSSHAPGGFVHLGGGVPLQGEFVALRHCLEKTLRLGPDALDGAGGGMAVDLEFGSIGFRRGFHPGRRNQGNNLAGGSREAQGASIALDHVQINGISVRTGRLVLVEQPDPVVELA